MQDLVYKLIMAPFALLYGMGVSVRNILYDVGLLRSAKFDIPVISVGNLSVGGEGKTPHIEFLIRFLKDYLEVATLSRGYKRKTRGFLLVNHSATAIEVGDEPLEFKRKFPEILVAVAEERTFAIPQMLMEKPDIQVVLLDDAFQHLSIQPGLNILVTDFSNLFTRDYLLPSGRLREWPAAYKRADIIIVSKCPAELSEAERNELTAEIRPQSRQKLYFSYYKYHLPYPIFDRGNASPIPEDSDVLVICAIANTQYLMDYLDEEVNSVRIIQYADHHFFSNSDIARLKSTFDEMDSDNKLIITTEKDAARLDLHREFLTENEIPIFVLPIEVRFHFDDERKFLEDVKDFLLNFKV